MINNLVFFLHRARTPLWPLVKKIILFFFVEYIKVLHNNKNG